MAGLDYICCNKCGDRMIYDGDREIRNFMTDRGHNKIYCEKCMSRIEKKIKKMEKIVRKHR